MNLGFNILWIDDDREFFDNWVDHVKDVLCNYNLLPIIDFKKYLLDNEAQSIKNKYDLILIDYNLSNDRYGTEIIQAIRRKALLPDIIFYSSQLTIESILEKEKDDNRSNLLSILQNGIYYTSADNLIDVAGKVIKKIISREQKINGFKGMVLSSVSEYEFITNHILQSGIELMTESQKIALKKYILNDILDEQFKSLGEYKTSFENGELTPSLQELLDKNNRILDHYKRSRIMKKMIKTLFNYDFDLKSYNKMIDLRNSLGHIPTNPRIDEGEVFINLPNGLGVKFDSKFVIFTRENILKWNNVFEDIKKRISK